MSDPKSVLIVLADHDRRVRTRKMCEESFGLTVTTIASPLEGLSLFNKIKAPGFILLSSDPLPLMTYEEFLRFLGRNPQLARIPVVLLSLKPVVPVPSGVTEQVEAPISLKTLGELVKKYCVSPNDTSTPAPKI